MKAEMGCARMPGKPPGTRRAAGNRFSLKALGRNQPCGHHLELLASRIIKRQ